MQTKSDGVPVRNRKVKAVVAALLLAGAIGAGPMVSSVPAWARPAPESFADLIDQVGPSVVLITAKQPRPEQERAERSMPQLPEQFREGPLRDFFEKFFEHGMPGVPVPGPHESRTGLGSGFIISSDGIVVTNNHVVGESEKIEITLKDGSHFPARLLGKDDKTDLAVLKIDADRPLPSVGLGRFRQNARRRLGRRGGQPLRPRAAR